MTAQQLRAKFEADLKALQDKCSHEKTESMLNEISIGHYNGTVLVCLNCEKVIEKKENDSKRM